MKCFVMCMFYVFLGKLTSESIAVGSLLLVCLVAGFILSILWNKGMLPYTKYVEKLSQIVLVRVHPGNKFLFSIHAEHENVNFNQTERKHNADDESGEVVKEEEKNLGLCSDYRFCLDHTLVCGKSIVSRLYVGLTSQHDVSILYIPVNQNQQTLIIMELMLIQHIPRWMTMTHQGKVSLGFEISNLI